MYPKAIQFSEQLLASPEKTAGRKRWSKSYGEFANVMYLMNVDLGLKANHGKRRRLAKRLSNVVVLYQVGKVTNRLE
jgi:hypothetical protein